MPICLVGGLPLQLMTVAESLDQVSEQMGRGPARIFFVNSHCVAVAQSDPAYKQAVERAEFVFNDGVGVELACRLLGQPVKGNLNGTDWIPRFFDLLSQQNRRLRIFFVGCKPEVVATHADCLSQRWPVFDTVGLHHGYYKPNEEEPLIQQICNARPDIVLVGMGVPRQELFLDQHWDRLAANGVRVGIAGGAIFDFLTGTLPRAPQWMRRARIEWIFRFWQEPGRLFYRYTVETFAFAWIVLKQWLRGFCKRCEHNEG